MCQARRGSSEVNHPLPPPPRGNVGNRALSFHSGRSSSLSTGEEKLEREVLGGTSEQYLNRPWVRTRWTRDHFENSETRTNESRFSCGDVGADDIYEVAGGFEGLLCFVMRNKSCVVIEGHIPLAAETVLDGEQTSVLGINPPPNEFDDRDVMAGLAPCPKAVTKHKS